MIRTLVVLALSFVLPLAALREGDASDPVDRARAPLSLYLEGRENAVFRLYPRLNHLFVAGDGP